MIPAGSVAYLDASVLMRAVLEDEDGHGRAAAAVGAARGRLISWAGVQVEAASALSGARRARRLKDPDAAARRLNEFLADADGIVLTPGTHPGTVPLAAEIAGRRSVRALDALHLATALVEGARLAAPQPLVFVTTDKAQATAARAEGLRVVIP